MSVSLSTAHLYQFIFVQTGFFHPGLNFLELSIEERCEFSLISFCYGKHANLVSMYSASTPVFSKYYLSIPFSASILFSVSFFNVCDIISRFNVRYTTALAVLQCCDVSPDKFKDFIFLFHICVLLVHSDPSSPQLNNEFPVYYGILY